MSRGGESYSVTFAGLESLRFVGTNCDEEGLGQLGTALYSLIAACQVGRHIELELAGCTNGGPFSTDAQNM